MTPRDLGLARVFAVARRRLRLAWLVATGELTVPVVGAAAVGLVLVGWLMPWRWPEPAALAVPVAVAVGLVGYAVVFRVSDFKVARALDRGLEQHDTVTTALELASDNPFAGRLHQQVAALTPDDASRAVRVPGNARPWLVGGLLLVAAVALAVVRNPADDDRDRLAQEQAAIDEVAATVEARAEELAEDPLTADLAAELDALADELARSSDIDEALERLAEATAELESDTDTDSLAERAASLGLSRTLEASPLTSGATPAEQLANLAEEADGLSDEDLAALADRLAELAETQEAGDPATAEALAQAAAAAQAGDPSALAAALAAASASSAAAADAAQAGIAGDLAAGDLNDLADQLAAAAAAQAANGANQAGQEGQGAGEGQAEGQGAGEGQGQGQGQGQGEGQGAGQTQGQGAGAGEGAGQGQGQGQGQGAGQGQGGAGMQATGNDPSGFGTGQNPDGESGGADEPSVEHGDATVIVPDGGESEVLDAAAQATGDGTTADPNRVNGLTGGGTSGVAVRDVVTQYGSEAVDALDSMSLAPSETEAVRSYFDYLADSTGAGGP